MLKILVPVYLYLLLVDHSPIGLLVRTFLHGIIPLMLLSRAPGAIMSVVRPRRIM